MTRCGRSILAPVSDFNLLRGTQVETGASSPAGSRIILPDVDVTLLPASRKLPVSTYAGYMFVVPVESLKVILAAD